MKTRSWLLAAAVLAIPTSQVLALNTPKASDGPIRLLGCVVSPNGTLVAQVDSQGDDAMFCNLRCNYEVEGKMLSHTFSETIPRHFQGGVGRFDTNAAKAGNYSGEVGSCKKVSG
jgi:hypothetical protein